MRSTNIPLMNLPKFRIIVNITMSTNQEHPNMSCVKCVAYFMSFL